MAADPLAEAMVEVMADTAKFRPAMLEELEASAAVAGEAIGKTLQKTLDAVTPEVATDFGEKFKSLASKAAEIAGNEAGVFFGRGLKTVKDAATEAAENVKTAFTKIRTALGLEGAADGEEYSKGLKATTKAGAESAGNDLVSKFGSVVRTGFLTLGAVGLAATAGITAFGVKSAGDLQQTNVAFTQLTGSAQAAQKEIADLQAFAASTPFEFKDVAQAATKLLAVGDAAGITQKNLIPVLTTIGDVGSAFGATGPQINGAVNALAQIAGAGKFDLGNLDQISDNLGGFPARAVLAQQAAQAWGVSTQEALSRISAGALPAQEGIQLLLKGMQAYPGAAGGMAKQSATLNGVLSTFADTARNSLSNAFAPAIPQITQTLNGLVPVMQGALDKLGPVLSGTLLAILPILGQILTSFASIMAPIVTGFSALAPLIDGALGALTPVLVNLLNALMPLIEPIGQIVLLMTNLAVAVITPLIPLVNQVTLALANDGMVDALQAVFAALTPLVPLLAGAFSQALLAILPVLPQLVTALLQLTLAGVPLVTMLAQATAAAAPFIAQLVDLGVLHAVIPIINTLAVGLTALGPVLGPLVGLWIAWTVATKAAAAAMGLLDVVTDANPLILLALAAVAVVGGLIELYRHSALVREVLADVMGAARELGAFIAGVFVAEWRVLQAVVEAVVGFFQRLPSYFQAGLHGLEALLSDTWGAITAGAMALLTWFEELPGKILSALLALPGQLFGLFTSMLGLALQAIGAGIGLIIVAIIELARGIIYAVTELPGQVYRLFTQLITGAWQALAAGAVAVEQFFVNLGQMILAELLALPGQIAAVFTAALSMAWSAIQTGSVAVLGFFTSLPGRVVSAMAGLAGEVGKIFSQVWSTAKSIVDSGITTAVGWFKAIPGKIKELAVDFVNAGKGLIKAVFDGFAQVPNIGAGIAKSVVNGVINAINWAIDQVDSGLADINIAGIGFPKKTIPDIPQWKAVGGVFDRPTVIGVGEAGREVLLPLSDPARTAQLAQQSGLMSVLAQVGAGPGAPVINMTVNSASANPGTVATQTVGKLARRLG